MSGPWEVKAVCKCGQTFRASFGKLFFVFEECCPSCGEPKDNFNIETVRWVPAVRSAMWPFGKIITPAHWEFRQP